MLESIVFLTGAGLVIGALGDFLWTTISLRGAGFITKRLAYSLWRGGRRLLRPADVENHAPFHGLIGPAILTAVAAVWILLHLLGYTLMYLSAFSLAQSPSGSPATVVETVAFSGSALSTLGASRVEPTHGWWDVLSMIAAINGMIVLTLSVSFVLSILQTTAAARTIAMRYHAVASSHADASRAETLRQAASLGPAMCRVCIDLSSSPFPGMFVPKHPAMDFPATVAALCDLLERPGTSGEQDDILKSAALREMRSALNVLGQGGETGSTTSGLDAARRWAERHSVPTHGGGEETARL